MNAIVVHLAQGLRNLLKSMAISFQVQFLTTHHHFLIVLHVL